MTDPEIGNDTIDFSTPDGAAQFLFWFGRSGNREQITERVIRDMQVEGNEGYREKVGRSALQFVQHRVDKALQVLGGKRRVFNNQQLMEALTMFYLQDRREVLRDLDPDLLAEIREQADAFLKEYT